MSEATLVRLRENWNSATPRSLGLGDDGIHLLGALAGKVLRVSPPLTISRADAKTSLDLLYDICLKLAERLPK